VSYLAPFEIRFMKTVRIPFLIHAIIFFSLLYALFFSPVLFEGKIFSVDGKVA